MAAHGSEETIGALQAIQIAGMYLAQHETALKTLTETNRHMDSVGGLLDPTLYRQMLHSDNYKRSLASAQAVLRFLGELREIGVNLTNAAVSVEAAASPGADGAEGDCQP